MAGKSGGPVKDTGKVLGDMKQGPAGKRRRRLMEEELPQGY